MPDHLRRLLQSMRRSLWRHGAIRPERLRHVVDERGDHHIAIVLKGDEVEASEPLRPHTAKAKKQLLDARSRVRQRCCTSPEGPTVDRNAIPSR